MKKAADAFRSIGEVSQLVGVAPHVLRYWESQFPLFSPVKRRDGRRYYRPDDVRLAAGLCELLREETVSIREAKKQMQADRGAALKTRGAARLGGEYAGDTVAPKPVAAPVPETADALPVDALPVEALPVDTMPTELAEATPAELSPVPSPVDLAQSAPRKRKAAIVETLPLFPELEDLPATIPTSRADGAAKPVTVDWLGRLLAICNDLQDRPAIPVAEASLALQQLVQARRSLAA